MTLVYRSWVFCQLIRFHCFSLEYNKQINYNVLLLTFMHISNMACKAMAWLLGKGPWKIIGSFTVHIIIQWILMKETVILCNCKSKNGQDPLSPWMLCVLVLVLNEFKVIRLGSMFTTDIVNDYVASDTLSTGQC